MPGLSTKLYSRYNKLKASVCMDVFVCMSFLYMSFFFAAQTYYIIMRSPVLNFLIDLGYGTESVLNRVC